VKPYTPSLETNDDVEKTAADWVTRCDAGLTAAEQQIFQDWLSAHYLEPILDAVAHELHQVLVGRDDGDLAARVPRPAGERGDDVVGLVALLFELPDELPRRDPGSGLDSAMPDRAGRVRRLQQRLDTGQDQQGLDI